MKVSVELSVVELHSHGVMRILVDRPGAPDQVETYPVSVHGSMIVATTNPYIDISGYLSTACCPVGMVHVSLVPTDPEPPSSFLGVYPR